MGYKPGTGNKEDEDCAPVCHELPEQVGDMPQLVGDVQPVRILSAHPNMPDMVIPMLSIISLFFLILLEAVEPCFWSPMLGVLLT